jgi:hypothetical protein
MSPPAKKEPMTRKDWLTILCLFCLVLSLLGHFAPGVGIAAGAHAEYLLGVSVCFAILAAAWR